MSSATELMALDLVAQAGLVRDRIVSSRELVQAAIDRLAAGRELNVLVDEQFEEALAAAARVDAAGGAAPGATGEALATPLRGVPFLLKDLGEPQAGRPERMGSRALRDHVAEASAWTVERYERAGLIICGRTNTPEFGNHCATEPLLSGPTLNPWDRDVSPGGSSGGSAVAVAAGLVGAASGGDGTGSIRMPASCCGLVGLKPRRGRSSGAPGAGQSLDGLAVRHALTRTVRDSAMLLDVTAGEVLGDPYTAPAPPRSFAAAAGAEPRPLRILRAERPPFPGAVDPRVQAVADAAARALEAAGHEIVAGAAEIDAEAVRRSISVIHAVDNAVTLGWLRELLGREPLPDELEPVTWDMAREGEALTAVDHARALDTMHAQSRRGARLFAEADVVLAPTLNTLPPGPGTLSVSRGSVDAFFDAEFTVTGWTALANVTGWAAISLPLGELEGLPVGVQLLAPEETVLLALAAQLELAMPWAGRRPGDGV
jgi:amidase